MELTGQDMHKAYGKVFPSMTEEDWNDLPERVQRNYRDIAAELNNIIEEKQQLEQQAPGAYKVRPDWSELQKGLGE